MDSIILPSLSQPWVNFKLESNFKLFFTSITDKPNWKISLFFLLFCSTRYKRWLYLPSRYSQIVLTDCVTVTLNPASFVPVESLQSMTGSRALAPKVSRRRRRKWLALERWGHQLSKITSAIDNCHRLYWNRSLKGREKKKESRKLGRLSDYLFFGHFMFKVQNAIDEEKKVW